MNQNSNFPSCAWSPGTSERGKAGGQEQKTQSTNVGRCAQEVLRVLNNPVWTQAPYAARNVLDFWSSVLPLPEFWALYATMTNVWQSWRLHSGLYMYATHHSTIQAISALWDFFWSYVLLRNLPNQISSYRRWGIDLWEYRVTLLKRRKSQFSHAQCVTLAHFTALISCFLSYLESSLAYKNKVSQTRVFSPRDHKSQEVMNLDWKILYLQLL